jgi:hypothetical protein
VTSIWRPTAVGSWVASRSEIEAAGGSRKVKLPNSTLRIADFEWEPVKDVVGKIVAWRRSINATPHYIVNSPQEEEMSKKTKRDHGTVQEPKPVSYTLPEPATEAPKAEPKAPRMPKAVDFAAEKEARPVGKDTKLGALLASLAQGATMEQLVEVLSKSGSPANPSVARSWLSYDVKRVGYGLRQDGKLFHLVFPDGMTEVAYKEATTPRLEVVAGAEKKAAGSLKPKSAKRDKAERQASLRHLSQAE